MCFFRGLEQRRREGLVLADEAPCLSQLIPPALGGKKKTFGYFEQDGTRGVGGGLKHEDGGGGPT